MNKITKDLLGFLKKSPTAFHAVNELKNMLSAEGYTELSELDEWKVAPGGKYYTVRNGSSIIAFNIAKELGNYHFRITSSHSDSPAFRIKENAELEIRGKYIQLNTEGYGGMLCNSWYDRPLSVAGRVMVKEDGKLVTKLVNFDRDLCLIPSVAIHMNRQANDGMKINKQVDTLPLIGLGDKGTFRKMVADEIKVLEDNLLSTELYVYSRTEGTVWGADNEFVSAGHLDDLQCAFGTLTGFLKAEPVSGVNVFACFDNEEVGSGTKQGADSDMLRICLKRINYALGKSKEDLSRAIAGSFMVSADNAHAVHPNHPEKTDAKNCTFINDGIVIKTHAGQKYTTDSVSMGIFKEVCAKAEVPVQYFSNRSDEMGGSTLGNIAMAQVSMNCVDIGLPQLAMHSAYETAGVKDTEYLVKAIKTYYSSKLERISDTEYNI